MMDTSNGRFAQIGGDRYYAIEHYDQLPPFFMTLVSACDVWMFLSSTGGLTAGRVQPENAMFPYLPVDQIHRCALHTGPRTWLRVHSKGGRADWEPFNAEQDGRYVLRRTLYKSVLGNRVIFEEENQSLGLKFSYSWSAAGRYGLVRQCVLTSLGSSASVELFDGVQNILPAGTPRGLQSGSSNLVDAYKWNELNPETGMATFSLYSQISDRAEPAESLQATTAFGLGLVDAQVCLAAADFAIRRRGRAVPPESVRRGVAGAYFLQAQVELAAEGSHAWQIVLNSPQTQAQVAATLSELGDREQLANAVAKACADDQAALEDLLARAEGFQCVRDERVAAHHTANTLFNIMRGGVFPEQYWIERDDFSANLRLRNRDVCARHQPWLAALPARIGARDLYTAAATRQDPQLIRLALEYLPLVFSRRHGDPSRPWNHFVINLMDQAGHRRLAYQGNWRDIFQNWEALLLGYPEFAESVIAKFVNASTLDGYNPYRISQEGIDWEEEDPDDPWANIGYWGDHQINYLLRLLELCQRHFPDRLRASLGQAVFSYADVPYRIADFAALLRDSKSTVRFDHEAAKRASARCATLGSDVRLVLDAQGEVYLVGLAEKLLVPLLAKLGNLVPGGGVWLNTQRPEWNDANNALVGGGLSMVTLCYMRRYVAFLQELFGSTPGQFAFTREVACWLRDTVQALADCSADAQHPWSDAQRHQLFSALGAAAGAYRRKVYGRKDFGHKDWVSTAQIHCLLDAALLVLDRTIHHNRRPDGLYHAYNLLLSTDQSLSVGHLYPMLEGQVAVLSAGVLDASECVAVLDALFASEMYRADQKSFMLYPVGGLQRFLDKNRIPPEQVQGDALLCEMLSRGDYRLVLRDAAGTYRFAADFANVKAMLKAFDALAQDYTQADRLARERLATLYESVFDHKRFTGRSGTMFGFEGKGCIYWHMVSKLLLAVQECYFGALARGEEASTVERLRALYYQVREGLGFNKTPAEYGAFPCDPYSHTPGHAGAQQPGMTGQVKEELITRQSELGMVVMNGAIFFNPALVAPQEFLSEPSFLRYQDIQGQWQALPVAAGELAYTAYQVPIVLHVCDAQSRPRIDVNCAGQGQDRSISGWSLSAELSASIFAREGKVRSVVVSIPENLLNGLN